MGNLYEHKLLRRFVTQKHHNKRWVKKLIDNKAQFSSDMITMAKTLAEK
jgi:hypothetical protein